MKHLDVLGTFEDYNFIFYEKNERLEYEFTRMQHLVLRETLGVPSQFPLEFGILLENNNQVIAGTFLNLSFTKNAILILNIYVDENYRRKGIHTTMHTLIDRIGNQFDKTAIFSNFHASNKIMLDFVAKKQGYEPFSHVVKRNIKK
jgi:N-acetylglutamate synthase-like GNAT family acetyltransferase